MGGDVTKTYTFVDFTILVRIKKTIVFFFNRNSGKIVINTFMTFVVVALL